MTDYCPNCGAETREGARFCYQCGTGLHAEAVAGPASVTAAATDPTIITVPGVAPAVIPSVPPPPMPLFPPPSYPLMPGMPFPQRSRMATTGFCLGLATVVFGIILTWLGTIMGVCGLIFSLIGLRETDLHTRLAGGPRTGRGLAIAGVILSVVGIIGSIALLVYILQNADRFGIQLPRSIGR